MSLHFIKYYTMNSWNKATAPAFNLKVYKVIPSDLRDKVFELLETENFYDNINFMIQEFDKANNYNWQAGFNGRSGGYLVLYRGGVDEHGHVYSMPGRSIDFEQVPDEVLESFKKLAEDIIDYTIFTAKHSRIKQEMRNRQYTISVAELDN